MNLFKAVAALMFAMGINCTADTGVSGPQTSENMKIKITSGEIVLTAVLYDNPTSRDLLSMLPITTELEEYASTELIFYPEQKLTSNGAPAGFAPEEGDIAYYAPWGNVALFYKGFRYSKGLISLGKFEKQNVKKLQELAGKQVLIEPID